MVALMIGVSALTAWAQNETPAIAKSIQSLNQVEFKTSLGEFTIELYPDKAPKTVQNFLQYVVSEHYNGTIFHRVIGNFMVQGGGFTNDMIQKGTRAPILLEANNGLKNDRGTIAMARTANPNSATAQFFVNVADNNSLNATGTDGSGYAVFGKVIAGMATIDKIRNASTGNKSGFQDVPLTPIVIFSATSDTSQIYAQTTIAPVQTISPPSKTTPQNQQPVVTQTSEAGRDPAMVRNELMEKGVWMDTKTGLMWARCMVGQTWTGSACSGTPLSVKHHCIPNANGSCQSDPALNGAEIARALNGWTYAGFRDWRLPTIEELQKAYPCSDGAIVPEASGETLYFKCSDGKIPSFDRDIFPNSGTKYPPIVLSGSASRECGGSCYRSLSWWFPFINSQHSVVYNGSSGILVVRSNETIPAWKTIQQNAKISIKTIEKKESIKNMQIQNEERERQQQEESRKARACSKGYFYSGKAVKFKPDGFAFFGNKLDAVVLGSGGGRVSIKLVDKNYLDDYGRVLEVPCYSDQLF